MLFKLFTFNTKVHINLGVAFIAKIVGVHTHRWRVLHKTRPGHNTEHGKMYKLSQYCNYTCV